MNEPVQVHGRGSDRSVPACRWAHHSGVEVSPVKISSPLGTNAPSSALKRVVAPFRSNGPTAGGPLDRDDEFRRFASRFLPTLLKGAYLLLHDVDVAEDAVQGTMLRVFMHWESARAAPEAYSRKTLLNVCRDYWRRRDPGMRKLRLALQEAQATESEIGSQVASFTDAVAERDALVRALRALPERQRDVLTLRFFFDLSVEDVAELLEIPEGSVKSAASRGTKKLHEELRPPQAELDEC